MPELPDVEMQKRYLESTSLGMQIADVEVRDTGILRGLSEAELKVALKGSHLGQTRRHGKYLFAKLDNGNWVVFHFGMDGGLAFLNVGDKEPAYSRLLVWFENGCRLSYVTIRKLGFVSVVNDVEAFIKEKGLGPDALSVSCPDFLAILRRTRTMAKAGLLDQSVVAGIGNIYADEILFQTKVHPRRHLNRLDKSEMVNLFQTMRDVLQTAIELGADSRRFPDCWIIPHRYEHARCPRCGSEIARTRISNRTTYYCPACQKSGQLNS